MSDKGAVFQKGGGGTNFEQSIQTAFLTTLIVHGNVPCVPSSELSEVAFQVTNRGYQTDDLLVTAKSLRGQHRLLLQIKHNISFTRDNEIFKEVLNSFWKDFNNSAIFDKTSDKLIVVKNGLTKAERNHLKSLFNWAINHATETDFILEVNRVKGKKERLEVFREILKEANSNTALTDKELWEFLKCVDVLEYDFLNEGSSDLTYFLNLIKLSRSENSSASEKEIWDSIFSYAATLNKDGGSATIESMKDKDFLLHFEVAKLTPYFKAVKKLESDGKEILRPIKTSIGKDVGEFHLPRQEVREKLLEVLYASQFTIVTGKPGVGKSAEVKEVLQKEFPNASIFVFRADQFSVPTIANVLSDQGINEAIQDIFSCISLIPEKIIFIDSLEKLLEADPECAFKQLLALLKEHPEIRIITSSRKYAVDLITLKFGLDKNGLGVVDIPTLNDEELKLVSEKFPQLKDVFKNERIKSLLHSPKYLDFVISAINKTPEDYSKVSLIGFKDKLWNSLVVDIAKTKNGLPIKRENAFMEIAVKRAKEMKLFIRPVNSDAEAIIHLENDEIVVQEDQNRKYAPAHDILEDWALVRYVSQKIEEYQQPKELFESLGNEPAIRRAFRLWVEDYLIESSDKIDELIKKTISDSTIEGYWADEILIAVFKSENSSSFFSSFQSELLDDKTRFHLLNRCIHLIKTACKERYLNDNNNSSLLIPFGSGWVEMLDFLKLNIAKLEPLTPSICSLLSDWNYRLTLQPAQTSIREMLAAKEIIIYYLNRIESEDGGSKDEFTKGRSKELVSILYQLAPIAKTEITELIERAFVNKESKRSWKLRSFYEIAIESCISGVGNFPLIKELPNLVVQTALREWKKEKKEKEQDATQGNISSMFAETRLDSDECWGLVTHHDFFPSGIFKTPAYNLLCIHPSIGLKFIVETINYSVNFYMESGCDYRHKFHEIEIELNDGVKIKQWAAWELWVAYRGISVTHYALESLLMSLEKYLLEIAQWKTETSRKNLKFIFNHLLLNSNNVSIAGVLTSVAIAYPEEVGEAMLPLLSIKEFYDWDLSRGLQESRTLAPMDNEISFAQQERWSANQLSHRKRYTRGLGDFIIDYQFMSGRINASIHERLDKLRLTVDETDLIWKKRLNEIDIRKWEPQSYDENLKRVIIQPKHEEEVNQFLSSSKPYFDKQNTRITHSSLITNAYERKEVLNFNKWSECYQDYSSKQNMDLLYDKPVTLAILGLTEFPRDISKEQKKWCIETIFQSINDIVQDTYGRGFDLSRSYNLMEKEAALSSFHLLMQNVEADSEKDVVIYLMIYMLISPFENHEVDEITKYVREVFFTQFPNEAKRLWLGLIEYSRFRRTNPIHYEYDRESSRETEEKEERFLQEISSAENLKLELQEIDLKKCEGYIIARVLVITPFDSIDKDFESFIKHFIPMVFTDLEISEDYSHYQNRQQRQIQFAAVLDIRDYLSNLLLNAETDLSKEILDLIFTPIYKNEFDGEGLGKDILEFATKVLENVIRELDKRTFNSSDHDFNKKLIQNFWNLWEHCFERIKSNGKQYFLAELFLDITWNENASHWPTFEGKREFYSKMVSDLGKYKPLSLINVFSTIGEQIFLPEAITWLVAIFKADSSTMACLYAQSTERLIERLFYNHISKIKGSKQLVEDYLWLLGRMIDQGSSKAYFFRENVITYKNAA